MARNSRNLIGSWAFLIGVILAIVLGLVGSLNATIIYVLLIIGILVGLLNVAEKEVSPFLLSGAILIIASSLGQSVVRSVTYFDSILQALLVIFVPATIIVAIKNVFSLARN